MRRGGGEATKAPAMPESLTIPRPDDMHLHLRDGAMLEAVTPITATRYGRAIIMPNLVPPVVTGAQAAAYRERIMAAVPDRLVDEVALCGPADRIRERLSIWKAANQRGEVGSMLVGVHDPAVLEVLAKEVL